MIVRAKKLTDFITGEEVMRYDIEGVPHHFPDEPELTIEARETINGAEGDRIDIVQPVSPCFPIVTHVYERRPWYAWNWPDLHGPVEYLFWLRWMRVE